MKRNLFNQYIETSNFRELFITEMGWNNPAGATMLPEYIIDERTFHIEQIAERSGFQILLCKVDEIPVSSLCKKLDTKLRKNAENYICIFVQTDLPLGSFHHLWVAPVKKVEKRDVVLVEYDTLDKARFLFEKMEGLSFGFETTFISDVVEKVQAAFLINSERITKDFYAGFKKEHTNFVKFITGIDDHIADKDNKNKQWYTSVMLNRLMFCYFIQKKGFLDGDVDYLRHKLEWTQQNEGEDRFFNKFYKGFLVSLFHDGLNAPHHDSDFEAIYGRIPYLNGGMFDVHQIEHDYAGLDIADDAFKSLFDFFDKWHWHLDDRMTATGRDINPDVLGYIFEQYINDRAQMGAYYTKEDITEYIGRNTIIPYLMDAVKQKDEKLFKSDSHLWQFFRNSGDRYIYDAMKKGHGQPIPDKIAVGIDTTQPNLLERRKHWNERTPEALALPTEIWRETIERLQRYNAVKTKIENGEITAINDFITYNLDIRQFVYDYLAQTPNHLFVEYFYDTLQRVTILDPTCGSGAFLFAALNILEPLYEVCLSRMQEFHEQNPHLFKKQLQEVESKYRSNIQYFIYKSIILRNLYGVDIMVEATEIAKLRLFLKMVAVVDVDKRDPNLGLDPLPDIDFNIRCGNTLVGYATEKELNRDLVQGDMFAIEEFKNKIHDEMDIVAHAYKRFKEIQLNQSEDMAIFKQSKHELKQRLQSLNDLLNRHMHTAIASGTDYDVWHDSHQPFHWLAEFYEIINDNGGFDVIIGNPPYVVYNEQHFDYTINNYHTAECKDLYAYVTERSLRISANRRCIGMIVPISIVSTDGFKSLRSLMINSFLEQWYSNFSMRPGKLFDGVEKHLSIYVAVNNEKGIVHSTKYHRWYSEERKELFKTLSYVTIPLQILDKGSIPKVGDRIAVNILLRINRDKNMAYSSCSESEFALYHTRKLRYFVQFLDKAPIIYNEDGSLRVTSELKSIKYDSDEKRYAAIALYLSTLFFWYFISHSDCRNLNKREVDMFPFNLFRYGNTSSLSTLGHRILDNLQGNSSFIEANYKKYGKLSMQVFQPRLSKPISDEIDKVLAKHYGFTEEELDFIINYDIKYRMGDELNEE